MGETHLFIIWENALNKKDEILKDISSNFKILKKYMITWSKENFSSNLTRFYGTNLPKGSDKETHCGNGPFMLIIVEDENPKYDYRDTSRGKEYVNVHLFDKKDEYRKLTGGGHKIHATNTTTETNHDITLLLGKNVEDFRKSIKDDRLEELECELFGSDSWNSAKDMFYALNNCIPYALLRNFEILPDDIYMNDHNDIDLICYSSENCAYILNAKKVFEEEYRIHYVTQVEGRKAFFDLRYVSDRYYDKALEEEILKTRIYNEKGFYTIDKTLYFYTLLYHALLHKPSFSEDYKKRLVDMNIEKIDVNTTEAEYIKILNKWLLDNGYIVRRPIDKSVAFNFEKASKLDELIYREEEKIKNLEEENSRLKLENEHLNTELAKILNSKGWKLVTGYRKIFGKKSN